MKFPKTFIFSFTLLIALSISPKTLNAQETKSTSNESTRESTLVSTLVPLNPILRSQLPIDLQLIALNVIASQELKNDSKRKSYYYSLLRTASILIGATIPFEEEFGEGEFLKSLDDYPSIKSVIDLYRNGNLSVGLDFRGGNFYSLLGYGTEDFSDIEKYDAEINAFFDRTFFYHNFRAYEEIYLFRNNALLYVDHLVEIDRGSLALAYLNQLRDIDALSETPRRIRYRKVHVPVKIKGFDFGGTRKITPPVEFNKLLLFPLYIRQALFEAELSKRYLKLGNERESVRLLQKARQDIENSVNLLSGRTWNQFVDMAVENSNDVIKEHLGFDPEDDSDNFKKAVSIFKARLSENNKKYQLMTSSALDEIYQRVDDFYSSDECSEPLKTVIQSVAKKRHKKLKDQIEAIEFSI